MRTDLCGEAALCWRYSICRFCVIIIVVCFVSVVQKLPQKDSVNMWRVKEFLDVLQFEM